MEIDKFSKSSFRQFPFDDDEQYLSTDSIDFDHRLTKALYPLISDHDFQSYYSVIFPSIYSLVLIPKHTPHSQKPRLEYVSNTQTQTQVGKLSFLESLDVQIVHSCNGMFLVMSQSSQSYYICNPRTRRLELLPSLTSIAGNFALNLAYGPYTLPYYKVICVKKQEHKSSIHQISIYSSKTRDWTSLGKPFVAQGDIDFSRGVFSNGSMHWMRRARKGLYLNLEDEVLREMPNPPLEEGYPLASCEYFGESQGHIFYLIGSPQLCFLKLFEMREDYMGWFLRVVIDLKALAVDFPIMGRRSNNPHPIFPRFECDVLSVIRGFDDEDLEILLSIPGEVITYNHVKKSARKLCDSRIKAEDRQVWYRVYASYRLF
ncbi:F-box protein At5g07610-like [Amaranthus tricolor]|uniref:F-box protein At5g07610-like n=1 Tax=Amaranthus tricolor TaxID=29722 RepID=UPI00258C7ACB|nr:F-box protein At5g07610-like [Amaranthus tricolor]